MRTTDSVMFMLVYVEDIVLIESPHTLFIDILLSLNKFSMKDLGPLHFFIGIKVCRDAQGLLLSQTKYFNVILDCVGMPSCNPTSTSVASSSRLSRHDGDTLSDPSIYHHIVGSLQSSISNPNQTRYYLYHSTCMSVHALSYYITLDGCQMNSALSEGHHPAWFIHSQGYSPYPSWFLWCWLGE